MSVQVDWDGKFWSAKVVYFDEVTGLHCIVYENGDHENVVLLPGPARPLNLNKNCFGATTHPLIFNEFLHELQLFTTD